MWTVVDGRRGCYVGGGLDHETKAGISCFHAYSLIATYGYWVGACIVILLEVETNMPIWYWNLGLAVPVMLGLPVELMAPARA